MKKKTEAQVGKLEQMISKLTIENYILGKEKECIIIKYTLIWLKIKSLSVSIKCGVRISPISGY
jgi:hypothetical protein